MIKNTADQTVAFQMIATADGSEVETGTPVVYVTGDAGTQGTGAGAKVHEGNGCWSYVVSAADSNYDHVAFTMVLADAVSQTVNVYPVVQDDYKATGFATPTNITAGTITTVTNVTNEVDADVTAVSGSSTAANNLELQYDGTGLSGDTFPAPQSQLDNLSTGSAAISTVATSFVKTLGGTETNTYEETTQYNEVYHIIPADGNADLDIYYEFNVGGNGVPVTATWNGYAQSKDDVIGVYAWNYTLGTPAYEQIGLIDKAEDGVKIKTNTFDFTISHVGTGTDAGKVRLRFYSIDCTLFATDRLLCSYAVVSQSVGYANGNIWVDTVDGVDGNVSYVNGTADNPVGSWANALVLAGNLGLTRFTMVNGSSITLSANSDAYTMVGFGWTLILNGQSIEGAYIEGAIVTGIGTATVTNPKFKECRFGAVTLPPCGCQTCGFGVASGAMASGSAGQFALIDCFSLVPGSGSPSLTFSGNGASTGINTRGWRGGMTYTIDSDCTLSHEVIAGGGTTVTTGGGDVEIRGITRSLDITMSAAETVQFVGVTGLIALSGTTTATVNLYGVASTITDTTSAATVNNHSVNDVDAAAILADTEDIQTQIGTAGAGLSDLGGMSTGMKAEVNAEVDSALNTDIGTPTADSIADYIQRMKYVMLNHTTVTKSTGTSVILKDNDSDIYATVTGAYAEDATTVIRKRLE